MNLTTALDVIATLDDNDLNIVIQAVNNRRKALRAQGTLQALATFKIGDAVTLTNLSPKYVNGATGTITSMERGTKLLVAFDDAPSMANTQARRRFGSSVRVPASCLKAMVPA